jgi:hypothetical protein
MSIKSIAKMIDKLNYPIIVLNIAVIATAFYKQGKLDGVKEYEKSKK